MFGRKQQFQWQHTYEFDIVLKVSSYADITRSIYCDEATLLHSHLAQKGSSQTEPYKGATIQYHSWDKICNKLLHEQ